MPLFQKGARLGSGAAPERWLVIKKLGEGQFAEVYEVRDMAVKDRDAKVSDFKHHRDLLVSRRPIAESSTAVMPLSDIVRPVLVGAAVCHQNRKAS